MAATMKRCVGTRWLPLFVVFTLVSSVVCWDTEDFEIFDVVEEVGKNFYELIGVSQTAKVSEIRRAYRKLSLTLHPDRNKAEDAGEKFRQINAVYEILKDENKRKRYDNVLEQGLPDWRQPVFYYRRARKMGLLEFAVVLLIILTIGQFLVVWSMYFEKKFELEEVFKSMKKKKDKKSRRGNVTACDEEDEGLRETLDSVPRPRMLDLLPCWLIRMLVVCVMSSPRWLLEFKDFVIYKIQQRNSPEEEEENEEELLEQEEEERRQKRRRMVATPDADFVPQMAPSTGPVNYTTAAATNSQSGTEYKEQKRKTEGEWSHQELSLLSKAFVRFPGGTPQRWEKVAEFVGRSVAEVTSKSKQMKASYALSVDPAAQGTTGGAAVIKNSSKGISDAIISTRESSHKSDAVSADRTKNNKSAVAANGSATGSQSPESWTQSDQKILEWALNMYPKTTTERWEKIAEHIPGKSKEDCILRFKFLAEMVKKRKLAARS